MCPSLAHPFCYGQYAVNKNSYNLLLNLPGLVAVVAAAVLALKSVILAGAGRVALESQLG